ncbi:potassium/proton antiporter [Echinicola marina]|uniref:potassium/proton antiporter n=1 Tax=Echinicola marina TaxID=2859768 RepID=UPI001CF6AE3C|nr:potassium/proton antiporter [Echinicola marina]UCS94832.1 potassium/proton antiporter [Echinicola marina]
MILTAENILLVGAILLIASILASKTAGRAGIPVLLLFLGIGMLAGSDGLGGIAFDDPKIAQLLGVVSLAYILFSGGLDTKWQSIKPVLGSGLTLSTLGVLLTAASVGGFAYWIGEFSLLESLLLGAIVSSTDAAAVFSILRTKSIGLKGNLRPLLELESGSNDPMAYFLTIGLTSLISLEGFTIQSLLPVFVLQMLVGGLGGYLFGRGTVLLFNKIQLEYEGLYPVLMLALVMLVYGVLDILGGNGFLGVYIAAVTIGNGKMIHKKSIIKFFDGIAWLMQIIMFITLGLLVFPSQVIPVMGIGFVIALFLIVVARPIGVFVSLAFFKFSFKDKLFVSWVGLRGAVPIVFATFPLIAGVESANMIFNVVFFIVLTSVALQATSLSFVAKLLKLAVPEGMKKKSLLDLELSESFKNALIEVEIPENSSIDGKKIVELGFPNTSLIVLINRDGKFVTPNGHTEIVSGDKLMVMMNSEDEEEKVKEALGLT